MTAYNIYVMANNTKKQEKLRRALQQWTLLTNSYHNLNCWFAAPALPITKTDVHAQVSRSFKESVD